MKSNTLKKVLSIVIIAIILAVATTTCVLAFVQKALYNPITDINDTIGDYYAITLCKDGVTNLYLNNESASEEQKEVVNKIQELSEKSTKASILSLMFQGTGSFEPTIKAVDSGDVMTSIAKASGQVCLVYDFLDEEQTLMWNDKVYTNPQATNPNAPITFRKLFIPIANNEEFTVCTAYLADSKNKSAYQIEFLAHQSEIYEYMVSLKWNFLSESK